MMPSAKERTIARMPLASGVREGMGPEVLPTVLISLDSRALLRESSCRSDPASMAAASAYQLPDCTISTDRFHT